MMETKSKVAREQAQCKQARRRALTEYVRIRDWLERNMHNLNQSREVAAYRDLNRYARLVCELTLELTELEQN